MKSKVAKSARALLVGLLVSSGLLSGCATTKQSHDKAASEKAAGKKLKEEGTPQNYGLYRGKEINRKALERGLEANYSPALDSY